MTPNFLSQYRNRRDIRLRPFREVYFQQSVSQLRFGISVVDRNLDRNFSPKMAIGALDTKICFDTTARRTLALEARNDQQALVPGNLHIGAVDTRHFDEDDELIRALADVHSRTPRRALLRLLLKLEIHTTRGFSAVL